MIRRGTGAGATMAVVLVLGAAGAPVAGQDVATYVVAQDGGGDVATITEALAVAADGDRVLIRPGTYQGPVLIERAVDVAGDGPRASIVIESGGGSAALVTMTETSAELSGVTLRGAETYVHLVGGAPTVHDVSFDGVGSSYGTDGTCHALFGPDACNATAVVIDGGAPSIVDSTFEGPGSISVYGSADALVEGNDLTDGAHVYLEAPGDGTIVRGNHIIEPAPAGIALYSTGRPLIEGNTIEGSAAAGIAVGVLRQPGIEPIIRGNTLVGNATGIELTPGAQPLIEGNELRGNTTAIVLPGFDGVVADNVIADNATGLFLMQGTPTLRGNTITGGAVGLGLGSDAAEPVLDGNTICDNETNVSLIFGAEMPDVAGNEICP